MLTRVWNLVRKEALQLWRSRLLLLFILLFPALDVLGVAEAVAVQVLHVPTAVYDQDRSPSSRRLVSLLRASQLFDPDHHVSSLEELEGLLKHGTTRVGLVIPPEFGASLAAGHSAPVHVLQDGTETLTALLTGAYLEGMAHVYGWRLQGREVETSALLEARSRVWFNEDLRKQDFNVPAEMTAVVAMLATLLPAVAIVRERESGTLEQLFVTPLRSVELILGKGTLAAAVAYLAFLEALAIATLYVGVPMRGSVAFLLLLAACYVFVELGWGLVISAVTRTQAQAFLAAFFWMTLESVLSGQVLPVENMPGPVQAVSWLMPNTHFTVAVRSIMLKGSTLADLWPRVLALGVLGAALYAFAAGRLGKRLD